MLYYEFIFFFVIYGILFVIGIEDLFLFGVIRVGLENVICLIFFIYIIFLYIGVKNCLRLLIISFLVLIVVLVVSLVVNIVSLDVYYKFLNLILNGVFFISFFVVMFGIIYYLGVRKIEEWGYIENFIRRGIIFLKSKIV